MRRTKFICLAAVTLSAFAGLANGSPEGAQPHDARDHLKLKPLKAEEFRATPKKDAKSGPGVRDHLSLKPLTAEEFKEGPKKDAKHGPGVRDHLNLVPGTPDDFKRAREK